mmetsp:Transcript_8590/g.27379  ORF Transcript_8590/g.27379 Transcript_8590/m.27379 type:complete len:244 (+) Transcript_8590:506-1237(+)
MRLEVPQQRDGRHKLSHAHAHVVCPRERQQAFLAVTNDARRFDTSILVPQRLRRHKGLPSELGQQRVRPVHNFVEANRAAHVVLVATLVAHEQVTLSPEDDVVGPALGAKLHRARRLVLGAHATFDRHHLNDSLQVRQVLLLDGAAQRVQLISLHQVTLVDEHEHGEVLQDGAADFSLERLQARCRRVNHVPHNVHHVLRLALVGQRVVKEKRSRLRNKLLVVAVLEATRVVNDDRLRLWLVH